MTPEELQAQIEALEEARDALMDGVGAEVAALYGEALSQLREELAVILESTDDAVQAAVTARARAQVLADRTRVIWQQWEPSLRQLSRLDQRIIETTVERSVSAPRAIIEELLGQWPQSGVEGSGLAGRFFALSDYHRRELADAVAQTVLAGSDRRQVIQLLAQRVERSRKQARRWVDDATIQHSRSVHARMAEDAGIRWYIYRGPLDSITRPFCRERLGHVYSRAEIEAMSNGQTGAGSVMVACGGYNCRHHWRPVVRDRYTDAQWSDLRPGDGDSAR